MTGALLELPLCKSEEEVGADLGLISGVGGCSSSGSGRLGFFGEARPPRLPLGFVWSSERALAAAAARSAFNSCLWCCCSSEGSGTTSLAARRCLAGWTSSEGSARDVR